jgi:hypothetical protein
VADYQIVQTITGHGNYVTATGDIHVTEVVDAAAARDCALLADLLEKVERFWVRSTLDPLVTSRAWLDVARVSEEGAVANPLLQTLEMEQAAAGSWQAPGAGAAIEDVYLGVGRALLILGEPGAGKTITLLKLAKALIARVRAAPELTEAVPVLLPLAGWGACRRSLEDWIVAELAEKYFITGGRRLLDDRRLVLLLDGLDELPDDRQGACVAAINRFSRTIGCAGMVVCSRTQDYANLIERAPDARLRLYGAIRLLPLSDRQIDGYLAGFGPVLEPLRVTLGTDGELLGLARTPLMLNLMAGACAKRGGGQVLPVAGTGPTWLLDAYVARMLARTRRAADLPGAEDLIARLGWLARQSSRHHQPLILLERLQPSWLGRQTHRLLYLGLSRTLAGAALGLVIGLCEWLQYRAGAVALVADLRPIAVCLLLGALAGAGMALIDAALLPAMAKLGHLVRSVLLVAVYGLLWAIPSVVLVLAASGDAATLWGEGAAWGLLGGAFFATRAGSSLDTDIRLPELLSWSWDGLLRGLIRGGLGGALLAVLTGLIYRGPDGHLVAYLLAMLGVGAFLGAAVGALFGGFQGRGLTRPATPNRGVRETVRGSLLVMTLGVAALAVIIGASTALSIDPASGLALGGVLGLALGLAAGLWYGGLAVVRHYCLRLALAAAGDLPLRPVPILDYACDLIFLRRIGGGWQFFHDLLRRHFAAVGVAQRTDKGGPSE